MAIPQFVYQDPLPLGKDTTNLPSSHQRPCLGHPVRGQGYSENRAGSVDLLGQRGDPRCFVFAPDGASGKSRGDPQRPGCFANDRYVALAMLRNADTSSKGILPFCQDTGTATIFGKKGQQVWTGVKDEEYLTKGVYKTYTEENLRYSQTAPLTMYDEVDTGTNLPAQIDLMATDGMEYQFSVRDQGRRLGE